jgi:uncharacterized protein YodC (DUF2158 family)
LGAFGGLFLADLARKSTGFSIAGTAPRAAKAKGPKLEIRAAGRDNLILVSGVTYMADGIKAGDVVQLKSGGPKMTVTKVEEWMAVMRAHCEWFVGDANKRGNFPLTSLKRAE